MIVKCVDCEAEFDDMDDSPHCFVSPGTHHMALNPSCLYEIVCKYCREDRKEEEFNNGQFGVGA